MSDEIKETAAEKNDEAYAKEKVGAVIYGVISAVNVKICYDKAPTFGELIDILTGGGENAVMQLFLTGMFILLAAVASTSAAAYFSRLIIGVPIRGAASYYVVAGALLYGIRSRHYAFRSCQQLRTRTRQCGAQFRAHPARGARRLAR